jgi:hypothetical protein
VLAAAAFSVAAAAAAAADTTTAAAAAAAAAGCADCATIIITPSKYRSGKTLLWGKAQAEMLDLVLPHK